MFTSIKEQINTVINRRFNHWLNKRMPSQQRQTLTQKNIFIFPSYFGFAYLFFILLLFILGTNYQNNLIILTSYLFGSLFITAMIYCFMNLAGLSVSAKGTYQGFAEDVINIPIDVSSKHLKQTLSMNFYDHESINVSFIDSDQPITLPVTFNHRGSHKLKRLILSSEYPFAFFHCWTKLQFDVEVIVYPKPLICETYNSTTITDQRENDQESVAGVMQKGEDFYELKQYQKGEPFSQVAWKQVAKGNHWMTKHYSQTHNHSVILTLSEIEGLSIEAKLRKLCYLVLQLHQTGIEFGLQLNDQDTDELTTPNLGEGHLKQCLVALATFNSPITNNEHR
jgi:uncharacterized protein (DUF58 family)